MSLSCCLSKMKCGYMHIQYMYIYTFTFTSTWIPLSPVKSLFAHGCLIERVIHPWAHAFCISGQLVSLEILFSCYCLFVKV